MYLIGLYCVIVFKYTATTENYTDLHTLSLHDALPISQDGARVARPSPDAHRVLPHSHRSAHQRCGLSGADRGAGLATLRRGGRAGRSTRATGNRRSPRYMTRAASHGETLCRCLSPHLPLSCPRSVAGAPFGPSPT